MQISHVLDKGFTDLVHSNTSDTDVTITNIYFIIFKTYHLPLLLSLAYCGRNLCHSVFVLVGIMQVKTKFCFMKLYLQNSIVCISIHLFILSLNLLEILWIKLIFASSPRSQSFNLGFYIFWGFTSTKNELKLCKIGEFLKLILSRKKQKLNPVDDRFENPS